jgi:crotonobetainyl-CoA:carnitine CoA-transferase CaiB-like acyl-CoA transferase
MVLTQEHPGHGEVRMLGFPIKFAEAACRLRRPAPELGGDSEEVLRDLGYSDGAITALRQAGVV